MIEGVGLWVPPTASDYKQLSFQPWIPLAFSSLITPVSNSLDRGVGQPTTFPSLPKCYHDPFPHSTKSASPPWASDLLTSEGSMPAPPAAALALSGSSAFPLPSAHSPNSPVSSARPPSGQRLSPNSLLTCIAAARRAQPLPFPVSRTACCAHQSENSKRDHPNDFRFLPGTELAGSEVRSGATSLARAGAGGQCDGLGAPGARGEGWAGAGPRPEGRRVAAFTLRSLEEAVAVLFTQMPS